MAYPLLQLWDEATSTCVYDFNDDTGANNAAFGSLKTWTLDDGFDLGSPDMQLTFNEPQEAPGGTLLHARHGLANMSLRCSVRGTSIDNLRTGVGALQRLLNSGGVLKWQPDAASEARYIDFLAASDIPQLWRGQGEEVISVFNSYADMSGLAVNLVRQPYIRGAKLSFGTNKLLNATLLTDAAGDSLPDGWTEVSTPTSESINAATESHQFTSLSVGEKGWSQVVTSGVAVGDVFTGSIEGKVVSGAMGEWLLRLEALTAADAVVGTYDSSNQTGTSFTRVSVTSAALPATTTKVKLYFLADNSGAGTAVFQFRRAQLEEAAAATPFHTGTEIVAVDSSASNGRILAVYVSGDAPAPVTLKSEVLTTTDTVSIQTAVLSSEGVTGGGSLSEYMNTRKHYQIENGTGGIDFSLVTDAGGSPNGGANNVMNISYATSPLNLNTRVTVTLTTLLDSMRGKSFDVYVRASHTVASTTSTFHLITYPGSDATGKAIESADVTFASSATMANVYKDVKVGTVTLPDFAAAGLVMQLQSARPTGTGALRLDSLLFVPTSEAVAVVTTGTTSSSVIQNEFIYSNPETGFVERLNTAGVFKLASLLLKGPQPVTLSPGLNLLYVANWGDGGAPNMDVSLIAATLSMQHEYSPRYYA